MSNSLRFHRLSPTRLLHPWNFPGKNTKVDCHFLLQGIFLTQGLNLGLPHGRQTLYHLLKPSLKDFEHFLASLCNERNCMVVWAFFVIAILSGWNEIWPFPVLWPRVSYPSLLAYWVQHFNSIIFKVWNNSAGFHPLH